MLVRDEKGIGLLEITIAMGLLGLISVAIMQFMSNMQKQKKTIEASSAIMDTMMEIRNLASSPETCSLSFGGINIERPQRPDDRPPFKYSFSKIMWTHSKSKVEVGEKIPGSSIKVISISLEEIERDEKNGNLASSKLYLSFDKGSMSYVPLVRKAIDLELYLDQNSQIKYCGAPGMTRAYAVLTEGAFGEGYEKMLEKENSSAADGNTYSSQGDYGPISDLPARESDYGPAIEVKSSAGEMKGDELSSEVIQKNEKNLVPADQATNNEGPQKELEKTDLSKMLESNPMLKHLHEQVEAMKRMNEEMEAELAK